jgi:hypothetical protein
MKALRKYAVWIIVGAAIAWQFRAPLIGKVWCFEDIEAYFLPLWSAAARAMRHGIIPTWDLGAWSGQPLVGDPQIGIFYPPNWIWLWVNPLRAYAWLALFHAGVAAAGMAALARARGRSTEAAALAGLALGSSAFLVMELRHSMFGATTAWLPWVLWAVEKYSTEKRLDQLAAGAGALGLAVLAGGWSMLWWGALVIGVYSLGRSPRGLLIMGVVGGALAAVQLFPAMAHARWSPRALGLEYAEASTYAWPSWKYAVTLLLPNWFGSAARGDYGGAPDHWELCGYAVGCVTGILALLSLGRRDRRGERLTLFTMVLLAMVLARGDGTPLHRFLCQHLPFYGSMRCPARALYVWTLIGPILGADGLDWMVERSSRKSLLGTLAVAALALELLVSFRAENPSTGLAAAAARPPAIDWLRANGRAGRTVNDVHLGQRWHNAGLTYQVESAGGYSSLPVWRYLHYLWISNHGAPYPHAHIASDLSAQGLWRLSSPLVDLLGVRWFLAGRDHPPDGRGWTRVFTGPDNVDLWRNDEAFPRGFVVYGARVAHGDEAEARALADPSFKPDRVAIVDRDLGLPESSDAVATPISALYRDSSLDLAVEVVTTRPGVLVLGEVWYPGWRLLLDGKPAELLRVDYALRGVQLPAGQHTVAMAIENTPLAYGAALSLTALALLAGLARVARSRRKR